MASNSARSTSTLTLTQRVSFARRGADFFGMSGASEFISAALLFAVLIAVNLLSILHQGFDSDEPQHLHVIWAWTRGLVQYRDVFDNHMPLFHILFAPVFGLIGERATILYWMRFIVLPIYFITVWFTYRLGALLFSRRAGLWAIIALGFYAEYERVALQFRPDGLWAAIWLLCLTVLLRGSFSARRALVAGVLLGFCFGISMKSAVLLISLLVSAILTLLLANRQRAIESFAHLVRCASAFLVGTALVPATIMIFFALKGVWRDFQYGVFDFNLLANRLYERHPAWGSMIVFILALYIARRVIRFSRDPDLVWWRAFVLIFCGTYLLLLKNFWMSITRQDLLPVYPLACVLGAGALLALSDALARHKSTISQVFRVMPLPAFVVFIEILFLVGMQPLWKDGTREHTVLLRSVLALTNPDDYVLDCKGETVFRPRCSRRVLEMITRRAIARGIFVDDVPQRCFETRTCVAATILSERFSEGTRRFVEQTYLPVANNLRVAGVIMTPSSNDPGRFNFEVVIPASYKIISRDNKVSGVLDGKPYDGARFLEPGVHTFESESTSNELFLLWSQAVDRGFTPFGRNTLSDSD
ncbi:MAG TPA: glycosyltransferase family 39 protein [Chthoniobacterales bacterium]|nr:glycosyltransferase family 39 protein [Chthoniobacterales bacterium]